MAIRLSHIEAGYPGKTILRDYSLILPEPTGAVAITGPSGSGKTTVLRILAGLLQPTAGQIEGLAGLRVSMVFQEDRLLPWCTARENVLAVLHDKDPAIREEKAQKALERMELDHVAHTYPAALSGGMQRRVSLARALAYEGDLLLLDEPFKGLDPALRVRIASQLICAAPHIVLVTHDPEEAALLQATSAPLVPIDNSVLDGPSV